MSKKDKDILAQYVPKASVDKVYDAIVANRIRFHISKERNTKLGDYRNTTPKHPPRISINYNLNPYEFLITFVHELAHHYTFMKYGRKHQPHGVEWKHTFQQSMLPYLKREIFPEDLLSAISNYLFVADLSKSSEAELNRVLRTYDDNMANNGWHSMETLEYGQLFLAKNGRKFRKLEIRRTNYLCECLDTNKKYVFSPLAMVWPLDFT